MLESIAKTNMRYRGLKLIGLVLKIAGGLEMAFGVVSLVLMPLILSGSGDVLTQFGYISAYPGANLLIGTVAGIALLFFGVVAGLLTFALGELINVAIAIEENTRAALVGDPRANTGGA